MMNKKATERKLIKYALICLVFSFIGFIIMLVERYGCHNITMDSQKTVSLGCAILSWLKYTFPISFVLGITLVSLWVASCLTVVKNDD